MSEISKKIINKIEDKKKEKENKLLMSAYKLFTNKGINNTSIQDIVDDAGVAKGTFYLYFKDKYKIEEALIIKKSSELFKDALFNLNKKSINNFDDQIIFVIDYVIDELIKNPNLINFISKDLSLGFYNDKFNNIISSSEIGVYDIFMNKVKENNINLKSPDVTLFMIIELVSSTCFPTITKGKPISINEYKPYLYETIKKMLNN